MSERSVEEAVQSYTSNRWCDDAFQCIGESILGCVSGICEEERDFYGYKACQECDISLDNVYSDPIVHCASDSTLQGCSTYNCDLILVCKSCQIQMEIYIAMVPSAVHTQNKSGLAKYIVMECIVV